MLRIEETRIAGGTLGGAFRLKNKTPALPGFCQIWSGKRDSNSRPRPWQGRALPTELFPRRKRNSTFTFGTVNWNSFPGAQNRHAARKYARPDHSVSSARSEEHTSELQSLMRISYAVLCL